MKRFILLSSAVIIFSLPSFAHALSFGAPFGGFVTTVIPCTCSVGWWMQYTPYWFGLPTPTTGSLYIPLGAVIFPYYQLLPGTFELGSYIPGPGACLLIAPDPVDPCIPLPAEGVVLYTGTSSLSPIPSIFSGFSF